MKTAIISLLFITLATHAKSQSISAAQQLNGIQKITFVETQLLNKEAKELFAISPRDKPSYSTNDVRDFRSDNPGLYQQQRGSDMLIKGGSTTYIIDGMQVQRR